MVFGRGFQDSELSVRIEISMLQDIEYAPGHQNMLQDIRIGMVKCHPRRHELTPHGAGGRVEVRAARDQEGHTTSPAPCSEDLLWLSRGNNNF